MFSQLSVAPSVLGALMMWSAGPVPHAEGAACDHLAFGFAATPEATSQLAASLRPVDLGDEACEGASESRSPCAPHLLYTPTHAPDRGLLVVLPGTKMEPDDHELLLEIAASAGYRALGLSYDDTVRVGDACAGTSYDARCHELARTELLTGADTWPWRHTEPQQAILPRLHSALAALDASDPDGGWARYYTPSVQPSLDDVTWDDIVVVGFSQGGVHASFLAHRVSLRAVVTIEHAADFLEVARGREVPASWVATTPHTPVERRYGALHAAGSRGPEVFDVFGDMPWVDIDKAPLGEARVLVTGQHPAMGGTHHGSMASDRAMPASWEGGERAGPDAGPPWLTWPYLEMFCRAGT